MRGSQRDPISAEALRETMRIWLLGGFRVSVGLRSVGGWRLRKAASLVKLLALAPGHRLHRERVVNLLWPDLETGAAINNLHRTLYFARRVLEPAPRTPSRYLRLRDEWLALCPTLWVDVEAFEDAGARARRAREPAAYRVALDLYAGELLPEDRYEKWAEERREELRLLYLTLLVELAGLYEEREEYGSSIEALQKVIANEPAHEEAHAGLMRLFTIQGRRNLALRQYEQLREALRKELGSKPDAASQRLFREILAGQSPVAHSSPASRQPIEPSDAHRHNLPLARTSFIGREQEMLEVKQLLAMTRLLTLTGTGGCGKTRLALEVATDLVETYQDGVWLVELAALSDPEQVPRAVAAVLEVREQPDRPLIHTLVDALRRKRMLLVLDNCEHLIHASARLADTLLSSCAHLRVLATSREGLGIAGEANRLVPSLTVPNAQDLPAIEDLMRYGAIGLFVERVRMRLSDFELTPKNARAVVEVCRKLEGIPLAIELATARMTALAVEQIAERLDDSLGLLTTGSRTAAHRQRTLRATLEWSYELLSEQEKQLFGRLSVFAGGWTLEAAEVVGAGNGIEEKGRVSNPPVLDLLSRLVDKSLVVTEAGEEGALRYRMLEPIRQYAQEKLEESTESNTVRRRHAAFFLALAEEAEPELEGAWQVAWFRRLETEHGNFRAALSWALDPVEEPKERTELGLRLAAALGRFWDAYGASEGREWLERGLARSSTLPKSPRAKALHGAGWISLWQGDYDRAAAMLEESLAAFKELGDKTSAATLVVNLGNAVVHRGDKGRTALLREEAELLRLEPLDRRALANLPLFLILAALDERDHEQAVELCEEGLALNRELGDTRNVAICFTSLGMIELERGDHEQAAAPFEEALRLLRERGDKVGIVYSLLGSAGVAACRGRPARAARIWGAAEALQEAIGLTHSPFHRSHYDYEGYLATARLQLDEQSFAAAWSEGRAMTPEQAVEYALGGAWETATPRQPGEPPDDLLTHREREVAILVARGLTNRQIAAELALSEHTVITHVRDILKKLGFHSRTRIAAWVYSSQQSAFSNQHGRGRLTSVDETAQ